MAFHVACPITCRRICFCALGFPGRLRSEKGKNDFLEEVARVEQFLNDPWLIKARENATVQVKVPKVVVSQAPPPPPPQFSAVVSVGGGEDEAAAMAAASAQVKRVALQKQAAAASMVAEDYARRFESGDLARTSVKDASGEEQGQSTTKIMCRLCFSGENEGSERARKMLSCNSCGKKYHRNCLKACSWLQIFFTGVLGLALLAAYVRCVEELEIQISLCSVKGVTVHTTVTVSNLHTRSTETLNQLPWYAVISVNAGCIVHAMGSVGAEDTSQLKRPEYINRPDTGSKFGDSKGHKIDHTDQKKGPKLREKDSHLIKFKNANSELSNISSKLTVGEFVDGYESVSPKNTYSILGKEGTEDTASVRSGYEVPVSRRTKYSSMKPAEDSPISGDLIDDNSSMPSISQASTKDRKPFLKFKIPKNSNNGNQNVPSNVSTGTQNPLPLPGKEEITYTRGQRSKRRRPGQGDEDASQWREDTMKDFTDANWILQKLGKDAAGKRVEVHQASNNSWHRGTVVEVFEGTSVVSIALDDGKKTKSFELGKQGIRSSLRSKNID
ncbi:hypothetical protein Sango_2735200 [Sesamum angolense]|uniref:Uncharacterized protein n=1 Tax=Sesamum angolense TaxID=2727404 RepID=A0AAE1T9P2_9LAMI|nr:hypothetical protein Sango_2735200 [Sesamum angolense]